jgi:Flp pilus assembly protein TadG
MRSRIAGGRQAAATVELAILLPFLATLLIITIDFCRVFYFCVIVAGCAEDGALYGSRDPSSALNTAGIKSAAEQDGTDIGIADSNVTVSTDSTTNPKTVTVTVTYSFTRLLSFPGIPLTTSITRSSTMLVVPLKPS